MLKFDKAFIKVDGEIIELPIGNCSSVSGSAQYWQAVYTADSDMPSGSTIEIPEGIYDPATDLLTVNQEGFILIQNFQYAESNNTITLNLDIPNGTNISVTVLKLNGKLDHNNILDPQHPGLLVGGNIITTANGNKLWRHYNNDSSVLHCPDILNGIHLRIFDAKFRGYSKYATVASNISVIPMLVDYNDPNTAKYNTDQLTTLSNTEAAHFCRKIGASLPTINELNEIYKNKPEIDSIDISVDAYPANRLSNWGFGATTGARCWSSSQGEHKCAFVVYDAGITHNDQAHTFGVIPVIEI